MNRTDTSDSSILCEESSTAGVLRRVAEVEGAIGYADAPDAQKARPGVLLVRIDGRGTEPDDLRAGYPFWTVEYIYLRATSPGDDSLAAAFVEYLTSDAQGQQLTSGGYLPCRLYDSICQQRP